MSKDLQEKGVHCANDAGKNFTGKGNGKCKGPMAAASPRNEAEASGVKKNEPEN